MRHSILSIALGVTLFFQSCSCHPGEEVESETFQFQNNSGHRVAVVMDDASDYPVPDSLVIADGDNYPWTYTDSARKEYPFSIKEDITVYYDDDVKVIYVRGEERDFRDKDNFVSKKISGRRYLRTYTFTVEDYEWAVLHNEL